MSPPTTSVSSERLSPRELGAWRGLLGAHAALIRDLDAELEAAHGLPLSSYEVLVRLESAPNQRMRMRDLAEAALLSRSGLTRLVDRLARDGLVGRCCCDSDARGSFAVLTEAGRERLQEARATHLEGVRRGFVEHFSDEELDQLAGFCERVRPGAADGAPAARTQ